MMASGIAGPMGLALSQAQRGLFITLPNYLSNALDGFIVLTLHSHDLIPNLINAYIFNYLYFTILNKLTHKLWGNNSNPFVDSHHTKRSIYIFYNKDFITKINLFATIG